MLFLKQETSMKRCTVDSERANDSDEDFEINEVSYFELKNFYPHSRDIMKFLHINL